MKTRPLPEKFYVAAPNKFAVKIKPQAITEITNVFSYQDESSDLPFMISDPLSYDFTKATLIKENNETIKLSEYIKDQFGVGNDQAFKDEKEVFKAEMRTSVIFVPKDLTGKGHYQMVVKASDIIDTKNENNSSKYLFGKVTLKPVLGEKNTFRLYDNKDIVYQWVNKDLLASDNYFTATSLPNSEMKQLVTSNKKEDKKKVAEILDNGVVIVSGVFEFKKEEKAKVEPNIPNVDDDIDFYQRDRSDTGKCLGSEENSGKVLDEIVRGDAGTRLSDFEDLNDRITRDIMSDHLDIIEKHIAVASADSSTQKMFAHPKAADTSTRIDENAIITSTPVNINYAKVSHGEGSYRLIGKLQAQLLQGVSCPANENIVEKAKSYAIEKINHTSLLYDNDFILFNQKYLGSLLITVMPKEMLLLIFNYLLNDKSIFHNFQAKVNLSEHLEKTGNPIIAKSTFEAAQTDSTRKKNCLIM